MGSAQAMRGMVAEYMHLQKLFLEFCADAKRALPTDNSYGIEIGTAKRNACDLTILDHPCRIRFDVRTEPPPMLGKLIFERLLPEDQTRCLWTLYFDRLGNADEAPDPMTRLSTLKGSDIVNFEAVRLLESFFKDIAPNPTA